MKRIKQQFFRSTLFASLLAILLLAPQTAMAQDTVFLDKKIGGKSNHRGKISKITPLSIEIGGQKLPAGNIKRVTIGGAPAPLARASERANDGRYADCLEQLKKITTPPTNKVAAAEIAFLRAYANAKLSLEGGEVKALDAGKAISSFVNEHPESYHLYPAIELKGKLLSAIGKSDLAAQEFQRLTRSNWPKYTAIGHFQVGETQLMSNQFDKAIASYGALVKVQADDDETNELKLIGNCQRAKALGLKGQTDQAIKVIQKVIREEDPENKRLFAYAYNALGACERKKGNLKEAALAYLHTDLLFPEPAAHAEALYYLTKIWPELGQTNRANDAQKLLRGPYKNSAWSRRK